MYTLIASDHAGFSLKSYLCKHFNLIDLGTTNESPCDYPVFAKKLVNNLQKEDKGILICGTGIGMSIVANRFSNIRAALCVNEKMAILARQHNDANILVLGARILAYKTAKICVQKFLTTEFEKGRHLRRLELINN